MKKFCLALDLIDDPELIAEYENYHQNIWPEVRQSILDSGIINMEIYRVQNRLFMIIEAEDSFSFESKNNLDQNNPKVQEWEELMWKFQQQLPDSKAGEKWRLMDRIFSL
ncbi:L-rhamnose mutarotase [Chryseobacterium sp. 09-1422]|uniref:L-rhamnose mutarotase n=1 Tax=Chryseobacterium kimseyorum TaxID=2984028 RepID=A0ABT3I299_9FLAO|nr:L-rhamnose mutarotase [Chryseobacterium kimseyorum]MCW3169988.1 L-rhamnose mutarotase [Chryseobacterium kimseyorum]